MTTVTSTGAATMTWRKRVYPNGDILYSGYVRWTQSVPATTWASANFNLPDDIAYDPAGHIISITSGNTDASISSSCQLKEGDKFFSVRRKNGYTSAISVAEDTTAVLYVPAE